MAEKTEDQIYAVNYHRAMADVLKNDPLKNLQDADNEAKKQATEDTKKEVAAYIEDKMFYRLVAKYLTVIVLAVVLGSVLLLGIDKAPTDGIIAIGSGAVGALIGIFSTQK
jgi:uncharacterized protein (DUF1015 family)